MNLLPEGNSDQRLEVLLEAVRGARSKLDKEWGDLDRLVRQQLIRHAGDPHQVGLTRGVFGERGAVFNHLDGIREIGQRAKLQPHVPKEPRQLFSLLAIGGPQNQQHLA